MTKLREQDAAARAQSKAGPEFSEALARGLAIVTAFGTARQPMTLSDIARAADLPRATARRALLTLAHLGYVEASGRLFRLTPKILALAGAYLLSNQISTVLQPACDRLAAELGEIVSVALLDGQEIVMVAHASPHRLAQARGGIGFRLPAFATALGRVLLAALPDPALDAFLAQLRPVALTPYTLTDPTQLRAAILAVGRQGYALVDQEAEPGFLSIAVPVRRYDGSMVAALNVGLRAAQASPDALLPLYLPRLQQTVATAQSLLV